MSQETYNPWATKQAAEPALALNPPSLSAHTNNLDRLVARLADQRANLLNVLDFLQGPKPQECPEQMSGIPLGALPTLAHLLDAAHELTSDISTLTSQITQLLTKE